MNVNTDGDRQLQEFIAKVVVNLPNVPKNIRQGWIENPTGLKKVLTEALLPPQKFEIWKTVRIGGFQNADAIREDIKKAGMRISSYANDILDKIPLSLERKDINLVLLSGTDYKEICKRAKELGLKRCPVEVGPCLRRQYENQPDGEVIVIATEPIIDYGGHELFHVERSGGVLWFRGPYVYLDRFWDSNHQFVFVIPQVEKV